MRHPKGLHKPNRGLRAEGKSECTAERRITSKCERRSDVEKLTHRVCFDARMGEKIDCKSISAEQSYFFLAGCSPFLKRFKHHLRSCCSNYFHGFVCHIGVH